MHRLLRHALRAISTLCVLGTVAEAQQVPYNQRVIFEAPPVALDSSTIQLSVIHVSSAAPLRALVCIDSPQPAAAVTDASGAVRISNLRQTNTHVRVLAQGFQETSLIFYPGKRGRSYATVRLEPDATPARSGTRDARSCESTREGP